jgi:DNA topoisomerase 2-associated protein PAT1
MSRMSIPAEEPKRPEVLTLEEIERQMMAAAEPAPSAEPAASGPPAPALSSAQPPPRDLTPVQLPTLAGSGYASQQALLDSMFPELGSAPPPGGQTVAFLAGANGQPAPPRPSPEEMARMQALHERITTKIESMS